MKSSMLRDEHQLETWLNQWHAFGSLQPRTYPCICILDAHGTIQEYVYWDEFDKGDLNQK